MTARREANRTMAAAMREQGVTPAGRAWDAARQGETRACVLRSLNLTDGYRVRPVKDARPVSTLRHGDILADGGTVTGDPVTDPETGRAWITLTGPDGVTDVELEPTTPVVYTRRKQAPAWVAACAADYRAARDAWEQARESDTLAPTNVPGVSGSAASMMQLEPDDYALAVPRPLYKDFLREYASRIRETA